MIDFFIYSYKTYLQIQKLMNVVLTAFCIMVNKLECNTWSFLFSIINCKISTSKLLLGKLLLRQENHKAEMEPLKGPGC